MLTKKQISVVVYAEPGLFRDSIYTILSSFNFVNISRSLTGALPGLEEIRRVQPAIILVDCGTQDPCRQGLRFDFFQRIKAVNPEIKCVAIADNLSDRQGALKNGADFVLMKGFTSRELQSIVQEACSGRIETAAGDSEDDLFTRKSV